MSIVYPEDLDGELSRKREAVARAIESIRDEDIDYSDSPALTDEELEQFQPVGDRFVEAERRNLIFINRLLNEYYAKKGIVI